MENLMLHSVLLKGLRVSYFSHNSWISIAWPTPDLLLSRWFQCHFWLELFWVKRTRKPMHRLHRWQTWARQKVEQCSLGTALVSPGRAGASPCVPWPYCINAECSIRGLSLYFVKLLLISAFHHTAQQCLCPLQICHYWWWVLRDGRLQNWL